MSDRADGKRREVQALRDEGLFLRDQESGRERRIARYIDIVEVRRDIDTKVMTLLIEFDAFNRRERRAIKRGALTRAGLMTLKDFGADVRDDNLTAILDHLHRTEEKIPLTDVYEAIGWGESESRRIFKLHVAVGLDARYIGDIDLEPRGSEEAQRALIMDEVVTFPPLALMLVIGLMAAVLAIIGRRTGMETIIVHMDGESSSGKTTGLVVCLSVAGYPGGVHDVIDTADGAEQFRSKEGLMFTLNSTGNAVLNALGGNQGVVRGLEELAMFDGEGLGKLAYQIASGEDKRRLNGDYQQTTTKSWRTVVVSTGEFSWVEKAGGNTGILMRLLEFKLPQWTPSSDSAERIKTVLLTNYGWLLPRFAEHLLAIGDEAVMAAWERWRQQCLARIGQSDRYANRIAAKHAVIMATAEMAAEALDMPLDLDGIWEVIHGMERESLSARDIGESAFEYLTEYANRNPEAFPRDGENGDGDRKGWVTKDGAELVIFRRAFEELLTAGHFNNRKVVEAKLYEKGYLDRDDDRPTRKLTVPWSGMKDRCYVLRLKRDCTPDADDCGTGRRLLKRE